MEDKFKDIENILIDLDIDIDNALIKAKAENNEIKINRLHDLSFYVEKTLWVLTREVREWLSQL